jgi:hydrogenase expression/formation protein HypE
MVGKVPPEALEQFVFTRLGSTDSAVTQGPAYGEDTAAIQLGDETLVINSDPISLAVDRVGTLAVNIACNDIAASGATPHWLTNVCILPDENERALDRITRQIDEAATDLGVSVIGGHAEYSDDLSRPLLSMTCMGTTEQYVPSSGANPGDVILLTGGAGIEGTAILATDFSDSLDTVDDAVLDAAASFFEEISVVDAASVITPYATSMHDPTEGGVLAGLVEMAISSNVEFTVERNAVPVRFETETLCETVGVDPLRIFGSGALLATVPESEQENVLSALENRDIPATVIGQVNTIENGDRDENRDRAGDEDGCENGAGDSDENNDARVVIDSESFVSPVEDDLYELWE